MNRNTHDRDRFLRNGRSRQLDDRFKRTPDAHYGLGTGTIMDPNLSSGRDRGHYGKGPKNWRFTDDLIKDQACQALYDSATVDASDIDVAVKNGVVTLTGSVPDRDMKREAEECVSLMSEVVDVQNLLSIGTHKEEFKEVG